MLKLFASVLLLSIFLQNVNSERILAVVMTASYSHQMFFQPLWRELAIRGHDVVVMTTDPTNEVLPNFKEISIHESYGLMKDVRNLMINTSLIEILLKDKWSDLQLSVNRFQIELPKVQELIQNKSEHFDLLMIEYSMTPALAFQHRFNCPMISLSSFDGMEVSHELMGNPTHSVLYPSSLFASDENTSFLNRMMSVVIGNLFNTLQARAVPKIDELTRESFGQDTPSLLDILERTDMLFVNTNPVFSAIRPFSPSTISLAGGMHLKPEKPLPKNLKDFLDSAKEGAIYFSLGSNVKSNELTPELRETIMSTLAQIPYKILWKFEDDSLPGKPAHVMITKWAPQQDILRHKNVKMFITQGGLQSLEESLYSHVPLVVMPFFADQLSNAQKVKNKGLGLVVDRHNLKVDDFKTAIMDVMENPSYRNVVTKYAKQIQDTPTTPLERAVWWTEYVLRHKGAQHLKGPRIPFYQYYYLDVLTAIGSIFLIICGLLFVIVKYSIKKLCGLFNCSNRKVTKKDKLKKH